jgi:hypothetical protein
MLMIAAAGQFTVESRENLGPIQANTEKGTYIPGNILTATNIQMLPIPSAGHDYAFYQSIKKSSNIVIGNFKEGEREILLIQDNNADGKVDIAAHWIIELKKVDKEGQPDIFCSAENFRKLKEVIINGKKETILLGKKNYTVSPNSEGISEIENLLKFSSNVSKFKQGLRIKRMDTDDLSIEMMVFSFSFNIEDGSADMAFDIKYNYIGRSRVSPVINMGIYCLKSQDPFAIETAKKLREISVKYIPIK